MKQLHDLQPPSCRGCVSGKALIPRIEQSTPQNFDWSDPSSWSGESLPPIHLRVLTMAPSVSSPAPRAHFGAPALQQAPREPPPPTLRTRPTSLPPPPPPAHTLRPPPPPPSTRRSPPPRISSRPRRRSTGRTSCRARCRPPPPPSPRTRSAVHDGALGDWIGCGRGGHPHVGLRITPCGAAAGRARGRRRNMQGAGWARVGLRLSVHLGSLVVLWVGGCLAAPWRIPRPGVLPGGGPCSLPTPPTPSESPRRGPRACACAGGEA
jgi:hypothetical protein